MPHAARLIAAMFGYLKDGAELHLSPFIGPFCTVACRVLGRELTRLKRDSEFNSVLIAPGSACVEELQKESNKILTVVVRLSTIYSAFALLSAVDKSRAKGDVTSNASQTSFFCVK